MCFIMVAMNSVYHRVSKKVLQTDLFKLRGIKGALKGVSGGFKVHKGVQGAKCAS